MVVLEPASLADLVAVTAGMYHSLGLKSDGSIVAWGVNGIGQCDVPAPNRDFAAVAAGAYHSLGLKSDGSIVAWGYSFYGQCHVPAPNTDFVAVLAGWFHSLGLKTDGSIVTWGSNDAGQCDVPAPNADFVAVAAGVDYSLGIKGNPLTEIHISNFAAGYANDHVLLRWTIRSLGTVRGFDIHRSDDENDGFQAINSHMIPPESGNGYIDRDVKHGQTYWYRLSAIDDEGT